MKKILFIIALGSFLTACKKDKELVHLNSEQRALLLYNVSDSFSLIKNETDTINFFVDNKESAYYPTNNGLWSFGPYYERTFIEYYNDSGIRSEINIGSKQTENDGQNFSHLFLINTRDYMNFPHYQKTDDYTLNNKRYKNCYLLTGYLDNDTMYVSTDVGILYIKSEEGDEYKLLEK